MHEIFICPKEQVTCIEKSEISDQNLYDKFTNNYGRTIYVEENGKVFGMITVGDFSRNCLDGEKLITFDFIQVNPEHEEDAVQILTENKWMESIPVINGSNQIEKEYCKRYYSFGSERANEIFKIIQQIIFETKYFRKSHKFDKIILYSNLLDEKQIEDLQRQADENIVILNVISIEEIKNYAIQGYQYVCDFAPESYRVREIFYKKFGLSANKWELEWHEIKECLSDRINYFNKGG